MSASRALRIGVLIRGQLVAERLFDGATPITLGQSLRCTLSVPLDGMPREHLLFVRTDGRWLLRTLPEMDGRLGQRDHLATFANQLAELPLERGARGKL